MRTILRILTAAAILAGAGALTPAGSAHIVPIDQASGAPDRASASESTCPLRAWPYIG
ncbi:hypothetical protein [Methylobacterium nonmethylotrophicum]|uniref:hypothetical protein n=1 Tax=Methylobacterium nonmethylotrophicum TaxID=1141884 RepID=UPI001436A50B|nr:hypothetical protein [Methylobacterium nonmethylotrophicum]